MSEDLIRRSDVIEITAETGALETQRRVKVLPTIEPKTKVVAQVTFDEEKLREIVKEAVERFKEEYEITDRPQGEWIESFKSVEVKRGVYLGTKFVHDGWSCSECSEVVEKRYPNCPYCLARMKGADDVNR